MIELKTPERIVFVTGVVGGLLALALVALAITTGSTHAAFQSNRPAADFAALLLQRAPLLRLEIGLDYLFLCAYTAFFAAVYASLRQWTGVVSDLAPVWLGAAMLSAFLDALENAHILAMLSMAERGMVIAQGEIVAQMTASQLKFVANYAGLLTLSFALPHSTTMERLVGVYLRWIQAPLGVAILVSPQAWVRPLALTRTTGFVLGLWAFAWIARARARAK